MSYLTPPRVLVATARGRAAQEYCDALREAGAEPVLIVPGDAPSLVGVDALVVTGGGDVDPALYGGPPDFAEGVDRSRDDLEVALLWEAREHRLPTLCICRGLQVANVAFGGTLIGDIPTLGTSATVLRHEFGDANGVSYRGVIAEHVVRVEPGSLLARTVRALNLPTGSRHHQAADRCADDLKPVGRTDDGIVEALEATFDSPFWLAVQWHPESTRDEDDGASRRLFSGFVNAARSARAERTPRKSSYPTHAEWLAGLDAADRRRADAMIERLERLGESAAVGWVRSEMNENIAQTARWVMLRPLWNIIDGWRERSSFDSNVAEAEIDPHGPFADAWLAGARMLRAGITFDEIAAFARGVAYGSIFGTLLHFDGAMTWPPPLDELDDPPHGTMMEVQDGELTGRDVGALQESLLSLDPSGREGSPQ